MYRLSPQLAELGSMSIGGAIIASENPGEYIQVSQVSADSGVKKVMITAVDMSQFARVSSDLISRFSLVVYAGPVDSTFKAIGPE